MDSSEVFQLLLMIGTNLFSVYALYKIIQFGYYYIKDMTNKEEL
ncbi:MAG TPA: hypothetical protein VM050_12030 [Patescibacteria group bacterium]|nr:hypothetical protein [Patescibacteria group bacterium]